MVFEHMSDAQILAELATRLDFLRRRKGFTERQVAERGGVSLRTSVSFRRENKDITLTSFVKLLRGVGEVERLEQLLPPAEPIYSPAKKGYVDPPKRVRYKPSGADTKTFAWGDGSKWDDGSKRGDES